MANLSSSSLNLANHASVLTENDNVPGSKFDSEPENYTVLQLKRWLKCRGLKLSGKRRDLLVRVKDCLSSGNHHILDVSIDDGKWFAAKVLKENNEFIKSNPNISNIAGIPEIPKSGWCPFPSKDIPDLFNYGHVYHYALESLPEVSNNPAYSDDEETDHGLGHMTDKPFLNGRKYVESGFVHDMTDAKTDKHYFIRAHVWPSMRNELPHNVLIILSVNSGAVIHASCNPCKVSALGRCSHVVAVLLSLVDHVKMHGSKTSTPCTSKECSWNKGQKRGKTPKRLSSAYYPSKTKKSKLPVIDFDPRPISCREVTSDHINKFVLGLQEISKDQEISMWEVQLKITYDDYQLENVPLLQEKVMDLIKNLSPQSITEIPNTMEQSKSEEWYSARRIRLTASKCLSAHRVGKLIIEGANNAAERAKKYISSNIWKLGGETPQTIWMKYGLESEPAAIAKYEEQTQQLVTLSGFWVNPRFPFLGCSPDGLPSQGGLLEIKSLKIFKEHNIESVVKEGSTLVSKDVLRRQCFSIEDGKCILKQSHSYYFQVQMQLLVTEMPFCDFVLYAVDGPVSIERIYRNVPLITEILTSLTTFWTRVIAPEIFEMRVPRDLLPFILPENTFQQSVNASQLATTTLQSDDPPHLATSPLHSDDPPQLGTSPLHSDDPPQLGTSPLHSDDPPHLVTSPLHSDDSPHLATSPLHSDDPPQLATSPLHSDDPPQLATSTLQTNDSPHGPHLATSSLQSNNLTHRGTNQPSSDSSYTKDELDIASFLVSPCTYPVYSGISNDLISIPWGGMMSTGIQLVNTCPIDNWMMVFQALVKSNKLNLDDLMLAGTIIKTSLLLVDLHQYADAKIIVLPTPPMPKSGTIDMYGNEADYLIPHLNPFLASTITTTCDLNTCPNPVQNYNTSTAVLNCPTHSQNVFLAALGEWLHPSNGQCQRKFHLQPPPGTPCLQDVTLDDNGNEHMSWHCSGVRISSPRLFLNFKNFFIFSVDMLSRAGMLTLSDVPSTINLHGQLLYFNSATFWNGGHYICMFNYADVWYMYDGMKEYRKKSSGLTIFHKEPHGYLLSYILYCI